VKNIELLEVNVDSALRYLSSVAQRDGTFKEDGTTILTGLPGITITLTTSLPCKEGCCRSSKRLGLAETTGSDSW
jgi:hypothetical protein